MEHYVESDGDLIRTFRYNPKGSVQIRTARQQMDILNTALYGRTLFIDGILQSAERDEDIYHTALVCGIPGLLKDVKGVKNVCILGGGEGATARKVLEMGEADVKVTMIDWDKELVDHFRTEPIWSWSRGASIFNDPRLTVEHSDVFSVISEARQYDRIFVDLTDPPVEDPLWRDLFIKLVDWLRPGGTMVMNVGGILPWDQSNITKVIAIYEGAEVTTSWYKAYVPSFGSEWGFVVVKKVVPMGSYGSYGSYFFTEEDWEKIKAIPR
jgi:spermidine synthase